MEVPKEIDKILKILFDDPAIILIGSARGSKTWKTGKTDFALSIAEKLLNLDLVEEIASNIDTFGTYPYIHDLVSLKYWLEKDKKVKLYILDEANIHLPSRRAMSNKSVEIIQVFPEISKAHARLIIVGQQLSSLDSELKSHRDWVKGAFEKLSLKSVRVKSNLLPKTYIFRNIPKTSIEFDPDVRAPFTLKAEEKYTFQEQDFQRLEAWSNGEPWNKNFKHPQEANRFYRKMVKILLSRYSLFTINSVEGIAPRNHDDIHKTI